MPLFSLSPENWSSEKWSSDEISSESKSVDEVSSEISPVDISSDSISDCASSDCASTRLATPAKPSPIKRVPISKALPVIPGKKINALESLPSVRYCTDLLTDHQTNAPCEGIDPSSSLWLSNVLVIDCMKPSFSVPSATIVFAPHRRCLPA
jgi:hypothetical protein